MEGFNIHWEETVFSMNAEIKSENIPFLIYQEKSQSFYINIDLVFIRFDLKIGVENVKRFKFQISAQMSESNTTKPKSKSIQGRKNFERITQAKPLII